MGVGGTFRDAFSSMGNSFIQALLSPVCCGSCYEAVLPACNCCVTLLRLALVKFIRNILFKLIVCIIICMCSILAQRPSNDHYQYNCLFSYAASIVCIMVSDYAFTTTVRFATYYQMSSHYYDYLSLFTSIPTNIH